ncbi:SOS response-associated peptidase [Haloechinothrix sp. LS1_15]|uniref:SOS response-associated peptidase n=1 Tax=Haloechinothrix sp. LS1_15 TaxID=2652248 RepID=UPI0029475EC5|nr:SOS response-associated peptidase [Haloechinothrix sp. LS1_15]MDV6011583.1 SOS response-associated peptidase [Haloechinothrix sp. LS1_15]
MCGRYAATKDPATIAREFDAVDESVGECAPSYNVAPGKPVPVVVRRHLRSADGEVLTDREPTTRVRAMTWGLVPFWAKDRGIGHRMINTRAETASTKPAFRKALARRRCLLPADGWFEWQRLTARGRTIKQPYYMTPADGEGLAFAGIWETWRDPELPDTAAPLVTCSVLTTAAADSLSEIHDRMPLVLPRQSWDAWLDPDRPDVAELLAPPPASLAAALEVRPVSTRVNNVANDGPELIQRAEQASDDRQPSLFDDEGNP